MVPLQVLLVLLLGFLLLLPGGCTRPALVPERREADAAIRKLQQGDFAGATQEANRILNVDPRNPFALFVSAVVSYKNMAQNMYLPLRVVLAAGPEHAFAQEAELHRLLAQAEQTLAAVEGELAVVSRHPAFAFELCPACWEVDWDSDGTIDQGDRELLEIELDEAGEGLPAGDPRRRPTFRLDHGDILWARAFVAFQRALLDGVLAYSWAELGRLAAGSLGTAVTIRLTQPDRLAQAQRRVLEALDLSDQARLAFLAEDDDDREWVPSPRQRSHPLPLPVDASLYRTWADAVGDLRRLVQGEEGLSIAELAGLVGVDPGDVPPGVVDVRHLLFEPRDITIDLKELFLTYSSRGFAGLVPALLGDAHSQSLKPSPLPARLRQKKQEIDQGVEPLERKLKYLFWIN